MSSTTSTKNLGTNVPLGLSVPLYTPHAISVSLPTWRDNVGYEEGEKRVADVMVSGYPRFFIHLTIQKLAGVCEQKYAVGNESCMLFPTQKIAEQCRQFMDNRSTLQGTPIHPRLVHLFICPEDKQNSGITASLVDTASGGCADLHIVLFPAESFPIAKEFWQHTGLGISSRLAEKCLTMLPDETIHLRSTSPVSNRFPIKGHNRHYSVKKGSGCKPCAAQVQTTVEPTTPKPVEDLSPDHATYLEERYGRNLPLTAASAAKRALRRRVAGVLIRDNPSADCGVEPCAGQKDLLVGPSSRGVTTVAEDDVYLYPTGMSAIWSAHQLAMAVLPPAKSVCFGFPYTDTLKILQKWGPGCHFLGFGVDSDIDELEKILAEESARDPTKPPVLALFTEFPSNPLLRSANLPRLRGLADKYDFLIVIDETIGNFVNVEVIPYADVMVSSLTKVFSGASNVMGGSLVLNPKGRHYPALKSHLNTNFEDVYFNEDAIYMERNSRDFKRRVRIIDTNAEAVCDFLRTYSIAGGSTASSTAIKEVFYPKYVSRDHYELCRIKDSDEDRAGGFGGLFSLTFTSKACSEAFFDTLPCYKGPSLGTNFTLACPFTILAHYWELEWAAQYGVEEGLVRISVGMEDTQQLLRSFEMALKAAEAVTV
ncbi:pyridoxal phosphate-dependent transferase [Crucibulum laeve]|uniref:cystathionine gamma-synthase n=1 Tax=Crucibulum laeve TaxID=68775 RepID=A0A5C3LZN1_9AGAR|nr:pyridoxal phosphate-dependent transferase [Crucibulum laeve]